MNKKLTDEDIVTARDMHDRGMSWATIGKQLRVTPEAARQAVKRLEARGVLPPTPTPEDEPAVAPAVAEAIIAEAEAAVEDETTEEGVLRGLIAELGRMQRGAKEDGKKLSYMRLRGMLVGQLAKLRPEPAPDPNDNPLVRLSAERCIAKLHELLDRV